MLNGRKEGQTPFSGVFESGRELSFSLTKEGFRPQEFTVTTAAGENILFTVTLESTDSDDGRQRERTAEQEKTSRRAAAVSTEKAASAVEESKKVDVTVTVVPESAEIFMNGSAVGTGSFTGTYAPGEVLQVRLEEELYEAREETLRVAASGNEYAFSLSLKPVARTFRGITETPVYLTVWNGNLVVLGGRGEAAVLTAEGRIISSFTTGIGPDPEGPPTIAAGRLMQIGSDRLVVADLGSGGIILQQKVGGAEQFPYGRRITSLGGSALFPGTDSITFVSLSEGSVIDDVQIAQGMRMVPVKLGENIITVNRKGQILVLDPTGAYEDILPTTNLGRGNVFSEAISPRIYLADDRGMAACADISSGTVLWETQRLSIASSDAGHYTLIPFGGLVFVYHNGTVLPLSASSGQPVMQAVGGLSVPPLVHQGLLYLCTTNRKVAVVNPASAERVSEADLPGIVTAAPVVSGGFIYAGLDDGRIAVINPEALK
jgi:outer membrane protein assembly factor BamB